MAGGFVFVVGPSGAGKDSLIGYARGALSGNDAFCFPRRVVTRPASEHEDHETLGETAFAEAEAEGAFALTWRAHGLSYAIPRSALDDVRSGRIAVCNVSRRVVPWARLNLLNVAVIEITAPVEVLTARLAGRARLEDGDLAARLALSLQVWTAVDASIVNDRSVDDGGRALVAFIVRHGANARPSATGEDEDRRVPRYAREG